MHRVDRNPPRCTTVRTRPVDEADQATSSLWTSRQMRGKPSPIGVNLPRPVSDYPGTRVIRHPDPGHDEGPQVNPGPFAVVLDQMLPEMYFTGA